MLLLLLLKTGPTHELDQRKQKDFTSWLEFSDGSMSSAVGYNDICFIFSQQISNWFSYLLILSNMTDSILYLMIHYLKLMSQGFHVVTGLTDIQMQKNHWILMCLKGQAHLFSGCRWSWLQRNQKITNMCDIMLFVNRAPNFVILLKDRLKLRLWPFAVKLLLWALLLRWFKVWDTSWQCLGFLLMVHVMYFVQTTESFSAHQDQNALKKHALLCRLLHGKRMNCCCYFWIA